MADSDRVVFPDEVEDIKAKAAEANKPEAGDTNTVEDSPAQPQVPKTPLRTVQPQDAEENLLQTFDTRKVQEAKTQGGVHSPVALDRGINSRVIFEKVGPNSRVVLQREVTSQPLVLEQQELISPNPNMIKVPGNCSPGEQLGKDGVCREVFE